MDVINWKVHPTLLMILRGKGHVYEAEAPAYHPAVSVVFQEQVLNIMCTFWVQMVSKIVVAFVNAKVEVQA